MQSLKTPDPCLAMWIPTGTKYGVGESSRGEHCSSGLQPRRCEFVLAPVPLSLSPAAMPNSGIALQVRGFAQPPPGRGLRLGSRPSLPDGSSRHGFRRSAGTAERRAASACLRALPAEFGVATRCVCVKLEGRTDGFPLTLPLYIKKARGCNDFPGWRRQQYGEHPQNRREAQNLPSAFHIPGVRCCFVSKSRSDSQPSLPPPPIPGTRCVRSEERWSGELA